MVIIKKYFFILGLILIILIGNLIQAEEEKINPEVYDVLEDVNLTRVVVELVDSSSQSINVLNDTNITSSEKYKNYVLTEVTLDELNNLENSPKIEKINIAKKFNAFLQDSVPLINANSTWQVQLNGMNITGTNETVCIIDTGANFTHPDLIGKNKSCVVDCYNKACIENCSISDDHGHGTHVAGIVGASGGKNGVAINISLIAVKVLNSTGGSSENGVLDLSNAIDYCVSKNVSVISMSLGTSSPYLYSTDCSGDSSPWTESVQAAILKNISVVAASGNDYSTTKISSPACIGNVTAVGATDKSDNIGSYSNRNSLVKIFAPGSLISSTSKNGDYEIRTGTSMATPHVSAAYALLRQFYRLQSNRILTPLEIQNIYNNSGKSIYDSSTGITFSRINVYSAIIFLENSANITLIYPVNSMINSSANIYFSCNATDNIGLNNLTLKIWDSQNQIYFNFTNISSGKYISLNANSSFSRGSYKWNCFANNLNNSFFYASNFSFFIGNISGSLNAPLNNSYFNSNNTNFTCSAQTGNIFSLRNITLMIWNSSDYLAYNITRNITGTENSTSFYYNFSSDGNYRWNCLSRNNNSDAVFYDFNYSLVYDINNPAVNLTSPNDLSSYTSNSQTIVFYFNVSDSYGIANCSLIVNDSILSFNNTVTTSSLGSFTQAFAPGIFNWKVNCTDLAGNTANSSSRNFSVTAPAVTVSNSPGGGGGGGAPNYYTYIPSNKEMSSGYTKELSKNDRIKFTFFDAKSEEHSLTVNEIRGNAVNITIRSSAVNLLLGIGQSAKLNLSSPDYYDIYVKLDSIENGKAKITIQLINELISPSEKKTIEIKTEPKDESEINEKPASNQVVNNEIKYLFIGLIIVTLFIIIGVWIERKGKRKIEGKEELKDKFNKHIRPKKIK